MKIINNKDRSVTKYQHEDGSETCIKFVPSQFYTVGSEKLIKNAKQKHKYSVLISCSSGCPVGCKMCYLSDKKYKYTNIKEFDVYKNVINAIQEKVKEDPRLKENYIKLCWMGMGDCFLDLKKTYNVSRSLLENVIDNGLAKGLDGVDLGTTFPKKYTDLQYLNRMNTYLKKFDRNPHNTKERSPLRVFYSLHRPDNGREKFLIPNSLSVQQAIHKLKAMKELCGIDVVFHQLFLENLTDGKWLSQELINLFNFQLNDFELRVLRFNESDKNDFKESPRFEEIVRELLPKIPKFKLQISPGSEVQGACGQFL